MKKYSKIDSLPTGHASEKITTGCLVLEGGAFRGVYTNGVLDALMLNDINLSCTIGVSAGSLNGLNYVSGQIGRSARINLGYRHNPLYVGFPTLFRDHGVIGFRFIFEDYEKIDPFDKERFFNPTRRFVAVATDCEKGEAHYFDRDSSDIFKAIQASSSMQYLSKPVIVDGGKYLDGGGSVHTPYAWALENGFEKIVIVKTRERGYRRDPEGTKLSKKIYKKYPAYAELLCHGHEMYNREVEEIEKLEQEGKAFVIYPSTPVNVSRLESDMEKLGALYWQGYNDTMNQLGLLKSYLGN